MSPSVFLPTMEEGNKTYKGQFKALCMATECHSAHPA